MPREREFIDTEGGLPGPEEISDEVRRTKEKKGAYRRDYLDVESVPAWLNDIGEERDEDDPLAETLSIFREFPEGVRREIVEQITFERERQSLNDKETLKRLIFLVERNDDLLKKRLPDRFLKKPSRIF